MKYLVLEDKDGIIHIMWCAMVPDEIIQKWATARLRWACVCEDLVEGRVLRVEAPPTCIECVRNLHEHAEPGHRAS